MGELPYYVGAAAANITTGHAPRRPMSP